MALMMKNGKLLAHYFGGRLALTEDPDVCDCDCGAVTPGSCLCQDWPETLYVEFDFSGTTCPCLGGVIELTYDPNANPPNEGWWKGSGDIGCDATLHVELRCCSPPETCIAYIIFDCAAFPGNDFGAGTPGPVGGEIAEGDCTATPFEVTTTIFPPPGLLEECGCSFDGSESIGIIIRATP